MGKIFLSSVFGIINYVIFTDVIPYFLGISTHLTIYLAVIIGMSMLYLDKQVIKLLTKKSGVDERELERPFGANKND